MPTQQLLGAPVEADLVSGKWILSEYYSFNGAEKNVLSGIQAASLTPEVGSAKKVFQQGGGDNRLEYDEEMKFTGSVEVLGGQLKTLLALMGKKGGVFSATTGLAQSFKSNKSPLGCLIRSYCTPHTSNVKFYEVLPELIANNFSVESALENLNIKVPVYSYFSPYLVCADDGTDTYTPVYEEFSTLATTFSLSKVPGVLGALADLPGVYENHMFFVKKFASASDRIGTILTTGFSVTIGAPSTIILTSALTTGQKLGVFYLGKN